MKRRPLRQRPSCEHPACRDTSICRRKGRRLAPGKPLERRVGVKRGGPIKPNPKRRRENFAAKFHSVEFVKWVHGFECAICGEPGWTVAAHVKRRSQGGRAEANIVPLCGTRTYDGPPPYTVEGCHERFDKYELENHRMRLKAMAKALWRQWCERNPNEGVGT